jgi:hypothetical protein
LWGFAYDDESGQLFWCGKDGHRNESNGFKIPVPVNATKEQLSQPFLLVSRASNVPNLQVTDIYMTGFKVEYGFCLLFKNEVDQIRRKRTEQFASFNELDGFKMEIDGYTN